MPGTEDLWKLERGWSAVPATDGWSTAQDRVTSVHQELPRAGQQTTYVMDGGLMQMVGQGT